jgi:hypothetical protein
VGELLDAWLALCSTWQADVELLLLMVAAAQKSV